VQTFSLAMFTAQAVVVTLAVAFVVAYAQVTATRYSAVVTDAVIWQPAVIWRLCAIGAALLLLGVASLILSLPAPHPLVPGLGRDAGRAAVASGELLLVSASAVVVVLTIAQFRRGGSPQAIAARALHGVTVERMAAVADDEARAMTDRPLLALYELCHQSVVDADRVTLQCAIDALVREWRGWITEAPQPEPDPMDGLLSTGGDSSVISRYVIAEVLVGLDEVIALRGLPSQHQVVLPQILKLASTVSSTHRINARVLLDYLEGTLVRLVEAGVDEPLGPVVEALFTLESHTRDERDLNVRVHQVLGSLGRAVAMLFPKDSIFVFDGPGFAYQDSARSAVLDALSEGFSQMTFDVVEGRDTPPRGHVWIEAMGVMAGGLLTRSAEKSLGRTFENHVSSLISDIARGTQALAAVNPADAGPVTVGLLVLQRVVDAPLPQEMEEAWTALCQGALRLAAISPHLPSPTMGEPHVTRAIEMVASVPLSILRSAVVEESTSWHPDTPPDHDAMWAVVRQVGVSRGTNFGMRFDETTGEPYADDDARSPL